MNTPVSVWQRSAHTRHGDVSLPGVRRNLPALRLVASCDENGNPGRSYPTACRYCQWSTAGLVLQRVARFVVRSHPTSSCGPISRKQWSHMEWEPDRAIVLLPQEEHTVHPVYHVTGRQDRTVFLRKTGCTILAGSHPARGSLLGQFVAAERTPRGLTRAYFFGPSFISSGRGIRRVCVQEQRARCPAREPAWSCGER